MKIKIRNSNLKKNRLSGFLRRMRTKSGRNIINRRRRKGRQKLTVV